MKRIAFELLADDGSGRVFRRLLADRFVNVRIEVLMKGVNRLDALLLQGRPELIDDHVKAIH